MPDEIDTLLSAGRTVYLSNGRYELEEKRGRGGMGIVYAAHDRQVNRRVAIKILRPDLPPEAELRFRDEVRTCQSLTHPNVVRVYDIRESRIHTKRDHAEDESITPSFLSTEEYAPVSDTKYLFLSMEFIPETLREFRQRHLSGDRLPWIEVRDIARQLIAGLQYASQSVVHRDLKPDNIGITAHANGERQVKIMDFGIARLVAGAHLTITGACCGALAYMAPEQLTDSTSVDWRADQYSLGVVLYELLTGGLPSATGKALRAMRPDLPRRFSDLVMRALEAKREDRWPSWDAMRNHLDASPGALNWLRTAMMRRPALAAGVATGIALLLIGDVTISKSVSLQEQRSVERILRNNTDLAVAQADRIATTFNEFAEVVKRAAKDPVIEDYLKAETPVSPAMGFTPYIEDDSRDVMFFVNTQGFIRARYPRPKDKSMFARDFSFRSYFKCAKALHEQGVRDKACLSRVIIKDPRTGGVGRLRYTLATPVYAADGRWIGVLGAFHNIGPTISSLRGGEFAEGDQITSLLGPMETQEGGRLTVVTHNQAQSEREYPLDKSLSDLLEKEFPRSDPARLFETAKPSVYQLSNYKDPLSPEAEPALAGFAAVGGTGYLVAVHVPRSKSLPTHEANSNIVVATCVLNAGICLPLLVGMVARRRKAIATSERP